MINKRAFTLIYHSFFLSDKGIVEILPSYVKTQKLEQRTPNGASLARVLTLFTNWLKNFISGKLVVDYGALINDLACF